MSIPYFSVILSVFKCDLKHLKSRVWLVGWLVGLGLNKVE